jgi:hypothetical protein
VVPAATNPSAGHAALVPLHTSATSQAPAETRQVVPALTSASAGHAALVPMHVSATSQAPADARHTVVDAAKASAGHAELVPVQVSATSQLPADARHTVPAFPATCRTPATASHESTVHGLPSSVASGVPGWHTPALHISAPLQTLPSLHDVPVFGGFEHTPVPGSHVPTSWHASSATQSVEHSEGFVLITFSSAMPQ